jgi:signal transduction histidine kinase
VPSAQSQPEKLILDYVLSMFSPQKLDLLVTIGGPAATFALKYREQLFPETPLLLAAVDQRNLRNATLADNEAVVARSNDASAIVQTILEILPQTRNVYVVVGSSPVERFWRRELESDFRRFAGRLTFHWSDGLSLAEIVKQYGALPPDSAIFYLLMSVDGKGVSHADEAALTAINGVANAPMFAMNTGQLGRGIVGGPLMSLDTLGRNAAGVAVRILQGESPANINTPPQLPGPPTFDWRELRRWNIPEGSLPPNSLVMFREPTLWERYRWYIIVAASIGIAEALLIAALVANLMKRRRAEEMARELGRQLMHAQETERARLARELHDDITQRLARLAIDVGLLYSENGEITSDSTLREVRDELIHLSDDVHTLAYRLHPALLERVGLAGALKMECDRFARQKSVAISMRLDEASPRIPEETALCLFRVAQEALTNVARHAHATTVQVSLRKSHTGLQLAVADDGVGLDSSQNAGLGLESMQERVRLLAGKLKVVSEPGHGTTVTAWVPLKGEHNGEARAHLAG